LAFTYDVATYRGQVRLLIADTDSASVLFEDDEIDAFLSLAQNNVFLAAAMAIESLLREKGVRLAKRVKRDRYETEEHAIRDLTELAKRLREDAVGAGVSVGAVAASGEHLDSYLPQWVPDNDITGIGKEH
jgi:hypothetical protein